MWKVRIVSCVPGSPMDCAAMMPTASPVLTIVPRARGHDHSTWRRRLLRPHRSAGDGYVLFALRQHRLHLDHALRRSTGLPANQNFSSVPGLTISSAATRPSTRSAREATTSPSLTAASAVIARSVPQSISRTIQSCATSTRRRVR